jgi:hypothetical protein
MGRACKTNGGGEKCNRIMVGKPLERPRCRWVGNIKIYLIEVG